MRPSVAITSLQWRNKRERQLRHSTDHVLTAEQLMKGWLFPLHPRLQSLITDCLRFSPGDTDNDQNTGATVGPKLSGLPGSG